MKFWEAMKAVEEGKTVRCLGFTDPQAHMWKDEMGLNEFQTPGWPLGVYLKYEWGIYEEPDLTFAEVVKGLKEGKKFRRKSWSGDIFIGWCPVQGFYSEGKGSHFGILIPAMDLFSSTDWIEVQ